MSPRLPVRRARSRPLAAGAALLAVVLAGCTGETQPDAASSTPTTPATSATSPAASPSTPATSSAPAEPSTSAAPSSPTATVRPSDPPASATPTTPAKTSPAAAPAADLAPQLLDGRRLPGFNEQYRWRTATTDNREPRRPFGTCQRFAMTSVGATSVAVRGFEPVIKEAVGHDSAGELVAEFPDTATARRAFAVLKSWRKQCADRLARHRSKRIGPLQEISTPGGSGGWYLLNYGPVPGQPDLHWFDAQGMAVVGKRIAMVEMILEGQDYTYDTGREPIVAAVQRAAARLS
jgi:hypothetical protein